MARAAKQSFICQNCATTSPRWVGKCPGCFFVMATEGNIHRHRLVRGRFCGFWRCRSSTASASRSFRYR